MLISNFVKGQHDIPIGTWRTHLSYQQLENLIIIDNKIYASGNNSFLVFDKEDNSLTTLSKINGFGDVDVSAMAYDEQTSLMVIGYSSGSIDLLKGDEIVNNYSLRNAPISGSKKINHITISGSIAYLSTDFGVVVFDLNTLSIREIYENIGFGGTPLVINASIIFSDSIFIATNNGIMAGSLNERINLKDFLNWRRFGSTDGIPQENSGSLAVHNGLLYAGIDLQGLYVFNNNTWTQTSLTVNEPFSSIQVSQNKLLIALENSLYSSSSPNEFTGIEDNLIVNPAEAAFDNDGKLWIADISQGLISNVEGSFRKYLPGGPLTNDISQLYYFKNKIIGLSGGYNASFSPLNKEASFFIFDKGTWMNFSTSLQNVPSVRDLTDVVLAPNGHLYFASFGNGLLEWDQNDDFNIIEEGADNTLRSAGNPPLTFITGIDSDLSNQLWITNYGVTSSLHSLNMDGTWQDYSFPYPNARFPLGVTIASNGDKWIKLRTETNSEIIIFNENSNLHRLLTNRENQGSIPGNRVNTIVEDHEGLMWIGTNNGVAYFLGNSSLFTNEVVNAVIPRHEGSFLLRGENVTVIKIDGGNRKWIGTTKGLYLFDGYGENLIQKYTINNSPLPSDHIYDIEIDDDSGEIFIATSKGLVSFRGSATRATREHHNVKIFPNPVRGNFTGQLGISGLAYNAIVKVTDIRGRLVRQLYAEGGTAAWDINDNSGRRVKNGVYLVLSASEDGEQTFIGKIAVID